MVANFGLFTTVGAEEVESVNFQGNARNLLEASVENAQTTGTISEGYLTLTEGQSITYTIDSDESTPVKFWFDRYATLTGTVTYDLVVNGDIFSGTLSQNGTKTSISIIPGVKTFDFVEGTNTITLTITGGTVSKVAALYIADAEYTVAATGTTVVHSLSNISYPYFEYLYGNGDNLYYILNVANYTEYNWRSKAPWYNLNVAEAGNYNVFLPSFGNDCKWSVTVNPGDSSSNDGTRYLSETTTVAKDGTYKVTIPLTEGKNTIRVEWNGTGSYSAFRSFSIAPESAIPVNFVGNTNTISEVNVVNAITTGTKSSGKVSLAANQSITYKIVSDEETDVRLFWDSTASVSNTTFDLSVNGVAQMTDASLSQNSNKSISIGKVSLAQGENNITFSVKSGTITGLSTLFIIDTEMKLSTQERTNIHALSTSNIFSYEEHLASISNAYISLRYRADMQQVARFPLYYVEVEETGDYDIYLPSQGGILLWDVWVNETPQNCSTNSDTFVNTTVTEDGLHKAVTVSLNKGENYICLAWNRNNKTNFSNFTGFAVEKTPDPNLVTATVSGSVAEGLAVSADLSNLVGNEVMAVVAVYKVKDDMKRFVVCDLDIVTATTEVCSLSVPAIVAEDGYTYEYKVYAWQSSTLAPYPVKIN